MTMVWLTTFAESKRLKLSVPVGWSELVDKQKQYKKKSGDVTKFVW
jgi:hypothetical protein